MTGRVVALLLGAIGSGCTASDVEAIVGETYHRTGDGAAASFLAHPDGTFEWVVHECDVSHEVLAQWDTSARKMIVTPGETIFSWPTDRLDARPARVEITPRQDAQTLDVRVVVEDADDPPDQVWALGGRCPGCDPDFGSIGPKPCEDPFEDPFGS
jgi:hypothetical protein